MRVFQAVPYGQTSTEVSVVEFQKGKITVSFEATKEVFTNDCLLSMSASPAELKDLLNQYFKYFPTEDSSSLFEAIEAEKEHYSHLSKHRDFRSKISKG